MTWQQVAAEAVGFVLDPPRQQQIALSRLFQAVLSAWRRPLLHTVLHAFALNPSSVH